MDRKSETNGYKAAYWASKRTKRFAPFDAISSSKNGSNDNVGDTRTSFR
jgi:hypothetical protein